MRSLSAAGPAPAAAASSAAPGWRRWRAAVGGAIPFAENMPGGLIPAALAQGQAGTSAEGAAIPELPRQERQAGGARRAPAGGGDARAPARRRHHPDGQILRPQQRHDSRCRQGAGGLEDRRRRRGQPEARAHARRAEDQVQAGDAAHGAGMRRQRPLVLHAAGARQPVDQRRRRRRRMDRRAACRRAAGRRRQVLRRLHRPLRFRPQPRRRQQGRDLARRADQEGDRCQQPRRLRHERAAAPATFTADRCG